MPIALIAMGHNARHALRAHEQSCEDDFIRQRIQARQEEKQVLAVAGALAENPETLPVILARKNTPFLQKARDAGFDCLPFSGKLLDNFRLWAWQRKKYIPKILAFGANSLPVACQLGKMRKKNVCPIYAVFSQFPDRADKFLSGINGIICNSSLLAKDIRDKLQYNSGPIKFVLPGIDLRNWRRAVPWEKNETGKHFVFGMSESLFPDSGAMDVARAMAALWQRDELPGWEVRMFGAGSCFATLLDEAKKLGVASRLSLLSEQPLKETAQLCHAWIAPGYSRREMPETLWAGVASELPIICSNTQLHSDWLPPETALSVPAQSPQTLASAMIKLIKNDALRLNLIFRSKTWRQSISLSAMAYRITEYLNDSDQPMAQTEAEQKGN